MYHAKLSVSHGSELQRSESMRNQWFRFDDDNVDVKHRPSDEIEDGRQTRFDERRDVNKTITRVSAGALGEEQWNFGVTVTKQVVVESLPRDQIV